MAYTDFILTFLTWAIGATVVTFITVLFAVAGLLFWRWFKYKITVIIYEKVGDAYIAHPNKAYEHIGLDDAGKRTRSLRLLKKFKGMKKGPLPPSFSFVPTARGKLLNIIYRDGIISPLSVQEHSPPELSWNTNDLLRVLDSWDADYVENLETHRQSPSFMDRFGGYIIPATVMFLNFILWLILLTRINGGGGQVIG